MPEFRRLDFIDGDFVLVESPNLLECDRLRAYHLELHKVLEGFPVWPPDIDENFYAEFRLYYQKIGDLLNPKIDCDRLTSISRHTFFVCTEPFTETETGKTLPGLSVLEQLMGYSYRINQEPSPTKTTGDATLDILTSVILIFKGGGMAIARRYSREDAMKMAIYANQLKTPEEEQKKNRHHIIDVKAEEIVPDDPIFIKNKEKILQELQRLKILTPPNW